MAWSVVTTNWLPVTVGLGARLVKIFERIENSIDFVALDPGFGEHLYAQLGNRKLLAVIA